MDGPAVTAHLEGWLLRDKDPFPYFFLVAMEAGSLLRAIALLVAFPTAWLMQHSTALRGAALRLYVLVACAGLREAEIEAVGQAVLPRFLAAKVRARAWKTLSSYAPSRRLVVSALPRAMLQSFVRDQLGAQYLIAPELRCTASGRCLGLLKPLDHRRRYLCTTTASQLPQALLSTTPTHQYMGNLQSSATLEQEAEDKLEAACMSDLHRPVMFHDGRLVMRPTPGVALMVLLWMPLGFLLAVVRVVVCSRAPLRWWPALARAFRIRVIVEGEVPSPSAAGVGGPVAARGMLLVCNHRTLLDPIFVSMVLGRPVTAATYSVSRLSEVLSPIETVRLEREAERDLRKLRGLVDAGRSVVVCPEGTTSREALLLRFSALFAQVTDNIVPVAIHTQTALFHGTTSRGCKALDPFFFMMNPVPTYRLVFLGKLPPAITCGAGGRSRLEVANYVQRLIASTLGFHCSTFTRRDKYRFLAGTDGSVTDGATRWH